MDVRPILTRIVPAGITNLGAGQAAQFIGVNERQDRVQFQVTNMDANLPLYVQSLNGVTFDVLYPQQTHAYPTSADLQVYNPNAQGVNFTAGELYPDRHVNPAPPPPKSAAGGAGGSGSGSGSGTGGGGYSGGGRSGGAGGGQPR